MSQSIYKLEGNACQVAIPVEQANIDCFSPFLWFLLLLTGFLFEPGLLCPLTVLLLEMKQIMYGEHRACVHRGNNTPSYKTPDNTDMWIILFACLVILSEMLSPDFTEVCQD